MTGEVDISRETRLRIRARQAHGNQVAFRIRAELVCCSIFARIHDKNEMTLAEAIKSRDWHDLCYWGEAAARLAEDPEQWHNAPTESAADEFKDGPVEVARRARRDRRG